jgi:Uma2 family endonuclease
MSTAAVPRSTPPPRPGASFDIGWRDVLVHHPDGATTRQQIPLTLEDALHPQEGDHFVLNTLHNRDWRYLQDVFENRLKDDPSALVLGDCKLLWPDGVHHSPDLTVLLGVREQRAKWTEFDVGEQGVRPRLIVELVSDSTRKNDVETKVEEYHRYRVPLYVIVDRPPGGGDVPVLVGYQYHPQGYRPMALEEDGRLYVEPLDLYLGVRELRVVAYDAASGRELGDYGAEVAARADAEARAAQEKARAEQERQRAEQEKVRAEQEQQRAEAEKQRAEQEKARADAAEARIRELEAALQARPSNT